MARYDKSRKLERNAKLKQYQTDNPDLSYEELGRPFGISAARAWVILNPKDKDSEHNE